MARAGAAAVLFGLVCCLLVGPAPARRPVELPPQVVIDAVDREASAGPLLPKPVAIVEAADPSAVLSVQAQEVDPAARQAPQVFRCGGEDMVVSEEPLSLDTRAQPAGKGEVEEDGQEQGRPEDSDSDTDTDGDSDSDDEDNEGGIMGWFWRLARRF